MNIAYCVLLDFEFEFESETECGIESETECGIESETESGTQYQICVDSTTKNPISN